MGDVGSSGGCSDELGDALLHATVLQNCYDELLKAFGEKCAEVESLNSLLAEAREAGERGHTAQGVEKEVSALKEQCSKLASENESLKRKNEELVESDRFRWRLLRSDRMSYQ